MTLEPLRDKATRAPPVGGAPLRITVQLIDPAALRELGVHVKLDKVETTTLLIVPPVALAEIDVAVWETAHGLVTLITAVETSRGGGYIERDNRSIWDDGGVHSHE